jgi:plastocyanin
MVAGNTFDPPVVTVTVGTTVNWVNLDTWMHGVRAQDGSWRAGGEVRIRGQPMEYTFNEVGEFPYRCTAFAEENEDGGWEGMTGTVVVLPAS